MKRITEIIAQAPKLLSLPAVSFLFAVLAALPVLLPVALAATAAPSKAPAGVTKAAPTAKADGEQKWDAVQAGARKEGALSLWTTSTSQLRAALVPPLKEKFGINLDLLTGNQGELLQKITAERHAGKQTVDMTLFSPVAYLDYLKPNGMVVPLADHVLLPDVKDDKKWLNGKFPLFDKDGTVVALTSAYFSYLLINTQLVKEGEIKSYRDLLNPKWKGKIVMYDPTAGPSAAETFVNYVVPRFMGEKEGEKFLKDLTKQDLAFLRDRRLQVEWVARGKYPIAIAPAGSVVDELAAAGAPITYVRPEEGGLLAVAASCLAIIKDAPHPQAATVFLNWVLTEEGQRIFSAGFPAPPRRLGITYTGKDRFSIVRPGDKTIEADEAFYVSGKKTTHWVKDIFGPVIAK